MGFDQVAEVCVFRIARSIGEIQLLRNWFEYHGFTVTGPDRSHSEAFEPRYETQPVQGLSAKWSGVEYETQYRARKGLLFRVFEHFYKIGGLAFNVRLSENGNVVSIEANWTGQH